MSSRPASLVLPLALPLLALAGCGTELGRVPFTAEGAGKTAATLKAGDVALWTDIDLEWEGDAILEYKVDFSQGGKTVATAVCTPLGPLSTKISWVETNLGGKHSRSGRGLMRCKASVPAGGPTVIDATLAFGRRPAVVKLVKADLIVKQ